MAEIMKWKVVGESVFAYAPNEGEARKYLDANRKSRGIDTPFEVVTADMEPDDAGRIASGVSSIAFNVPPPRP